jgi:hypothetical protein
MDLLIMDGILFGAMGVSKSGRDLLGWLTVSFAAAWIGFVST